MISIKYSFLLSLLLVIILFPKPEFQGSTTVGERGQVVLPAELRKKHGIKPGDKLLVISNTLPNGSSIIMLMEGSVLNQFLRDMTEHMEEIMKAQDQGQEDKNK